MTSSAAEDPELAKNLGSRPGKKPAIQIFRFLLYQPGVRRHLLPADRRNLEVQTHQLTTKKVKKTPHLKVQFGMNMDAFRLPVALFRLNRNVLMSFSDSQWYPLDFRLWVKDILILLDENLLFQIKSTCVFM